MRHNDVLSLKGGFANVENEILVWQFSWLEYLPVTQGVAGSSPVHTAEERGE